MQLHEVKEMMDLFSYLPYGYVAKVQKLLWKEKQHLKSQHIRLVKCGNRADTQVLAKIIEVAKEEKTAELARRQQLKSTLSGTKQSA